MWRSFLDAEEGSIHPEGDIVIQENTEVALPFNLPGFIEFGLPNTGYEYMYASGELFYIPDETLNEREAIGTTEYFSWTQPGTYEVDIYLTVLAPNKSPLEKFLAWLVPTVYAQTGPEYLETIRFSVVEGLPPEAPCCSSVFFLPGIQGSVLMEGDETRWPPTVFSDDIERLALTAEGDSVNDIYVEDILTDFYGVPVYEGIAEHLNGLAGDGLINGWKPFAYDWRLSPEKIVSEGVQKFDGEVESIVEELQNLASESKTGKVAIVAHSMGGLVGKALIEELVQRGEENLVESFLMVGTPQLGTPQGAASLLHGDDMSIPGGWFLPHIILNPEDGRTLAHNMQSAYNLLPSPKYFEQVTDPAVSFSTASFTEPWRNEWGNDLDTYTEFKEFITGVGVARTDPEESDLDAPEILQPNMVDAAKDFHETFDEYVYPDSIRVVQVAGWGRTTVKSIEYKNKHIFFNGYETKFTREGDETVVYPSAISSDDLERYFFNLDLYRDKDSKPAEHKDLLNTEPVQDLLGKILKSEPVSGITNITNVKPSVTNTADQILVSTRSPVALGVYDTQGRFTGVDVNQNQSSGLLKITEDIPGSTFISSGGDQHIFLPKEGTYTFNIQGTGTGPATVETGTFIADNVVPSAIYTDIPVTTQTLATFTLDTEEGTLPSIEIDSDADGVVDTTVLPDAQEETPTIGELISRLKDKINSLNIKAKLKTKLLNKVTKIEKKIAKGREVKASKVLMRLEQKIIRKGEKGAISDTDVQLILDLLDQIERAL